MLSWIRKCVKPMHLHQHVHMAANLGRRFDLALIGRPTFRSFGAERMFK